MKILIVDDNEQNIYLLRVLLESQGYKTASANNGSEALKLLQEEGADFIISDILMPVMDGFQLCRKVKGDESLSRIPLLFYTATYTGPQDEEFAQKIGADGFLLKPAENDELLNLVRKLSAAKNNKDIQKYKPETDDKEVYKLYNERLIRKLEQKMLQAEEEIKARKAAEAALRSSEKRLIEAQRMAKSGDFTWNTKTGEVSWSIALYELIGYDPATKIDADFIFEKIHYPEDRQQIERWIKECLNSKEKVLTPFQYRVLHSSGKPIWTRTTGIITEQDGADIIFATIQDISERKANEEKQKQLQEQLMQAQKMESVGRLAGGVAHDFNNLLSIILGYGENILETLHSADPIKDQLSEIVNAGKRAATLTRQLLAFSRKQPMQTSEINLNSVIQNMEKMLRRLISEDIKLSINLEDSLPKIVADPGQLEQILMNLVINARDAMQNGGSLIIETKTITLEQNDVEPDTRFDAENCICLKISDTGTGIAPDILPHIFEPFFTTKESGKGTGLGLSTVYGIVKQSGGNIKVKSQPGEGTEFCILLPVSSGKTARKSKIVKPIGRSSGNEHILVVEDEESLRKLAYTLLSKLGYKVSTASNGEEAIFLVEEKKIQPDLIITDVIMPGINGILLANRLHHKFPELKVLYMSGYSDHVTLQRDIIEPGLPFIQKPFNINLLAETIRQLLAN
jgi:two-component system, cell cycle sensor histidine kinase and response regulator CckA